MTWYTAKGILNSDSSATIKIRSEIPWPTINWEITDLEDDGWLTAGPPRELLYALTQSGTGVLSENAHRITISIPVCPFNDFSVKIGTFKATFNLRDDKGTLQVTMVATDTIRLKTPANSVTSMPGPNFILFSNSNTPLVGGLKTLGIFNENDTQIGWALGTTFTQVEDQYDNTVSWPWGGVTFTKFFWFTTLPTTTVEDYLFIPKTIANRGGGGSYNFEFYVRLKNTEAIAPKNSVFTVEPTHEFKQDGVML